MSAASSPAAAVDTGDSLLSTLRAFTRALETRRALQAELDQALSSFLTSTPSGLSSGSDALAAPLDPDNSDRDSAQPNGGGGISTCRSEALRPPSEDELQEVLRIGFAGLVEIKEEARLLQADVEQRWRRTDLARVLERIEGWESERIRAVSLSALLRTCGVPTSRLRAEDAMSESSSLGNRFLTCFVPRTDSRAGSATTTPIPPDRPRLGLFRRREERAVRRAPFPNAASSADRAVVCLCFGSNGITGATLSPGKYRKRCRSYMPRSQS